MRKLCIFLCLCFFVGLLFACGKNSPTGPDVSKPTATPVVKATTIPTVIKTATPTPRLQGFTEPARFQF